MSTLHPHWQETDDETPVPIRVPSAATNTTGRRVSRAPAAIIGILLIVMTGFFAYGGLEMLTGQITTPTPDVTIRITQDGPVPPSADIRPGQTIRFVNNDQIPHVLTSQTLPTDDGQRFNSPGLFTNEDFFYTVPVAAQAGTHSYISETEESVVGEIVIVTSVVTSSSSSSASLAAMPISSAPTVTPPSSDPLFPLPVFSSSAPSIEPTAVLAVNPHVVGTRPPGSAGSSRPTVINHRPASTTESGPAVWIVLTISTVAILLVTRSAFRKV